MRKFPSRRRPLWLALGIIGLLTAVVLALSFTANIRINSLSHTGHPVKTTTVPGADSNTQGFNSAPHPENLPEQSVSPSQRLLAAAGNLAMRGTTGSCEAPGTVELSTDMGQHWVPSPALIDAGATRILNLIPSEHAWAQVVALDADCHPRLYQTADFGDSWEGPFAATGLWYLDPAVPNQLSTPAGMQSLPCSATHLSAVDARAMIRCPDGTISTTVDGGRIWQDDIEVGDVLAMNSTMDSHFLLTRNDPSCRGFRLRTLGENPVGPQGCFPIPVPEEEVAAGRLVAAQTGNRTLLWAEEKVFYSEDGGWTWH